MQIRNKEDLVNFCFSDFNVESMNIDRMTGTIVMNLEGAIAKIDDKLIKLSKGYLKVERYDSIEISSYDAPSDNQELLSEGNYEVLKQLCEIEIKKNVLTIKGYAVNTFHWIEFEIKGGEFYGEFEQ